MHWARRIPFARERVRRLAKRLAPAGPIPRDVEGLAWRLHPRDNKADFDLWYKGRLPEAEERAFLRRHLGPGDLFVDIGANIGLYTVPLLASVPGLRAVAFEPLERMRKRFAAHLALNGVADRAEVRAEAVGPEGHLTLHESGNAGRTSLLPFDGARPGAIVPVRPLAALLSRPPSAIKVDVEGFEAEALLPYFDETGPERWPRAVVIETLHHAAWRRPCLQELFQRDYVLEAETEENALLHRAAA